MLWDLEIDLRGRVFGGVLTLLAWPAAAQKSVHVGSVSIARRGRQNAVVPEARVTARASS
jgi:hypothetical protein